MHLFDDGSNGDFKQLQHALVVKPQSPAAPLHAAHSRALQHLPQLGRSADQVAQTLRHSQDRVVIAVRLQIPLSCLKVVEQLHELGAVVAAKRTHSGGAERALQQGDKRFVNVRGPPVAAARLDQRLVATALAHLVHDDVYRATACQRGAVADE